MTKIIPTIFTNNIADFNQLFNVYKTLSDRIQIDIAEARFAQFSTIDLPSVSVPADWKGDLDLHMMVASPSSYLPTIIKLHPSLCIFHAECNENLLPIFEQLSNAGIKTGVALLKSTYPGDIKPYLQTADHALIFGGTFGKQGAEADLLQLEKAALIKEIDSNIEISWDGGAVLDNVRNIAHNNIDIINVGSALSRSQNITEAYKALTAEVEKQGVNI